MMPHLLSHYPQEHVSESMLSTGDTLLTELAEEAQRYLRLLERLEQATADDEREDLEAELYASISHFKSHSEVTLEYLNDLGEMLPDDSA
jgi:CHASE3 domain sensor protein